MGDDMPMGSVEMAQTPTYVYLWNRDTRERSVFAMHRLLMWEIPLMGMAFASKRLVVSLALPPLAEAGDADAQVSLGYMYQTGQSFEQSYSQAARWYRPAAEQGNALAQFALGELYARGLGVEHDYGAAAYWFGRAAMAGNVSAQIRLANFYEKGLGVAQDYGEAALWYGRASRASRGLNAPPPAIERLAGRAFGRALLIAPPRIYPAGPPQAAGLAVDRIVLRKPEAALPERIAPPAERVWVHVASFRTPDGAANQWRILQNRHAVLLDGLTVELARTDLGGDMGVWIRLLAGPLADMTAAQSLCAALQARDVYCAPIAP
ncbi:MAG: SEL1-like repeat protein [Proteobacteria bacterium]|nr:SEL1-like repeat protein [Pseudomonadota bacterium]